MSALTNQLGMALSLPLALGHHSPPKPSGLNGTLVRGGVDEDGHDKIGETKTKFSSFSVYVGNLPFSMTKQWNRETFSCYGDIPDIFLSRKPKINIFSLFWVCSFLFSGWGSCSHSRIKQ